METQKIHCTSSTEHFSPVDSKDAICTAVPAPPASAKNDMYSQGIQLLDDWKNQRSGLFEPQEASGNIKGGKAGVFDFFETFGNGLMALGTAVFVGNGSTVTGGRAFFGCNTAKTFSDQPTLPPDTGNIGVEDSMIEKRTDKLLKKFVSEATNPDVVGEMLLHAEFMKPINDKGLLSSQQPVVIYPSTPCAGFFAKALFQGLRNKYPGIDVQVKLPLDLEKGYGLENKKTGNFENGKLIIVVP